MFHGIVFNEVQRNAFLAMAARDKLICEKGFTDGVYKSRTCRLPSYGPSTTNILRQFLLAGAVYVDPFTYECLDGELIDSGIILPYKETKGDMSSFLAYDVGTIQNMMSEKEYDVNVYTTARIEEMYSEWIEKVEEFLILEKKHNLNYDDIWFRHVILKEKISNEINIDYYLALGDYIYHSPIYSVLTEYKKLFNIAYYNDLLCPVVNASMYNYAAFPNPEGIIPKTMEADTVVHIYECTSNKLGIGFLPGTVKDCVRLVQSAEAKAYRDKVDEWLRDFSLLNFDAMEKVENDIIAAQKAMRTKKLLEISTVIAGTIGIVASCEAHCKPSPFAEIAEVATYWGALAFVDPTKRYLWASFGKNTK